MTKPKLLDLFCCAGGAGMGYHLAGFDVVGVDIKPRPRYPFKFYQGDALEFVKHFGEEFDAIHASPPCQAFSVSRVIRGNDHPDLVDPTRQALIDTGKPWVIENVEGSPLKNPTMLCGAMFGLRTYRHRLFETSFYLPAPAHPEHTAPTAKMGRPVKDGEFMTIVGNFTGAELAREILGTPWMTRDEMSQSIPPAYSEYVGRHLLAQV